MSARREIRERIRGANSIRQITQVMKTVSLAKVGRARSTVQAARPYDRLLHEVVGRMAGAVQRVRHPLLEVRAVRRTCFVVITADRGLSGGFDVPVLRRALDEACAFPEPHFVAVGKKAAAFLDFKGLNVTATFVNLDEDVHIKDARSIAHHIIDGYVRGHYDLVHLVYSEFAGFSAHRPVILRLIPVPLEEERNGVLQQGDVTAIDYLLEPAPEAVVGAVLPLFIEEAVFHALTESKASEHSARLTAMDRANRNADEMIEQLTIRLHRSRQAAVTGELLDILSATAALGNQE